MEDRVSRVYNSLRAAIIQQMKINLIFLFGLAYNKGRKYVWTGILNDFTDWTELIHKIS